MSQKFENSTDNGHHKPIESVPSVPLLNCRFLKAQTKKPEVYQICHLTWYDKTNILMAVGNQPKTFYKKKWQHRLPGVSCVLHRFPKPTYTYFDFLKERKRQAIQHGLEIRDQKLVIAEILL